MKKGTVRRPLLVFIGELAMEVVSNFIFLGIKIIYDVSRPRHIEVIVKKTRIASTFLEV